MGLFSVIGNVWEKVKSIFRPGPTIPPFPPFPLPIDFGTHTSTSTTTYEPDRVKAAQLENERVELMRQAQLEIIEAQTRSRIAQEQARAQGFAAIAQAITTMQEKLNDIAERRIAIIERGTLQAVKEAEGFYSELAANIQADNDAYTLEKLPALLEILGKYEDDSPAQKLYM